MAEVIAKSVLTSFADRCRLVKRRPAELVGYVDIAVGV